MAIRARADRLARSARFFVLSLLAVPALLLVSGCRAGPPPPAAVTVIASPSAVASPTPSPTPPPPFSVFFASDRGGQAGIYRLAADGQARLVTTNPGGAWDPAVHLAARGGARLAVTTYAENNGDIALVGAAGGRPTPLVTNPADDYQAAWSPDGTQIAFVSERDGGQDLYLVRPDRPGEEVRLTAGSGLRRHRHPAWPPDGRALIFAGVDTNGVEELYRLDLAEGSLTTLTAWPLKATMPAVSPTGDVAFIGWEDSPTRTLSLLPSAGGPPRTLLTADHWIGQPAWSADGEWLLFTAWQEPEGGHDLYAIPAAGGEPQRLTAGAAWDDVAAALPGAVGAMPPRERPVAPAPLAPGPTAPALGFNIADLNNAFLIRDLGGRWVKGFVDWARTEPVRGEYDWRDADNTARGAESAGLALFLRLHNAPVWSHPGREAPSTPPDDPADFARFAAAVAARYRGRVVAYELWNEPNLAFEWGNASPDPDGYVALLRTAYPAIKAADPNVTVVVGALSSTAGGSAAAMGDLEYLAGMYAAGAARGVTHDAIATHPYGFGRPPAAAADGGLGLRHVEAQRAMMAAAGDESPLWITETGWPSKAPAWDLGEHAAWALDLTTQAAFYSALPATVAAEWPFVAALFPFNLDFSTVAWYPASEQMRAYALLNPDGSPRPAYTALRRALRGR